MKKCSKCNTVKNYTEFHKSKRYKDGLDYKCKQCEKERSSLKYQATYNNHEWRLKQLINFSKQRTKKNKLEHTLTLEELKEIYPTNNKCPVFGITFEWGGNQSNSPSIDRIDNDKGYTKNNCQVISARANSIKSNATIEELESVVNYLKATQLKQT
jgi:regulatory protein YycI of two-component signal transduction system YycFG